jgi:hypothetical protein
MGERDWDGEKRRGPRKPNLPICAGDLFAKKGNAPPPLPKNPETGAESAGAPAKPKVAITHRDFNKLFLMTASLYRTS